MSAAEAFPPAGEDPPPPVLELAPGDQPAAPGSPLERLRRQRDQATSSETRDLIIPGWRLGVQLVARHRKAPYAYVRKLMRHLMEREGGLMDLASACDLLITSCQGIYLRDLYAGADAPLEPLEVGGEPVVYGPRLLELLERPPRERVREALRDVYHADDVAIVGHANLLLSWMSDADALSDSSDEEAAGRLGES